MRNAYEALTDIFGTISFAAFILFLVLLSRKLAGEACCTRELLQSGARESRVETSASSSTEDYVQDYAGLRQGLHRTTSTTTQDYTRTTRRTTQDYAEDYVGLRAGLRPRLPTATSTTTKDYVYDYAGLHWGLRGTTARTTWDYAGLREGLHRTTSTTIEDYVCDYSRSPTLSVPNHHRWSPLPDREDVVSRFLEEDLDVYCVWFTICVYELDRTLLPLNCTCIYTNTSHLFRVVKPHPVRVACTFLLLFYFKKLSPIITLGA